eukprot:970365-Amphidinium_carterae.1
MFNAIVRDGNRNQELDTYTVVQRTARAHPHPNITNFADKLLGLAYQQPVRDKVTLSSLRCANNPERSSIVWGDSLMIQKIKNNMLGDYVEGNWDITFSTASTADTLLKAFQQVSPLDADLMEQVAGATPEAIWEDLLSAKALAGRGFLKPAEALSIGRSASRADVLAMGEVTRQYAASSG